MRFISNDFKESRKYLRSSSFHIFFRSKFSSRYDSDLHPLFLFTLPKNTEFLTPQNFLISFSGLGENCVKMNHDVLGMTLPGTRKVRNRQDCIHKCQINPQCYGWVYTWRESLCDLKNSHFVYDSAVPIRGKDTGAKHCQGLL